MFSSLPKSHQLIQGENITACFYSQTKSLHLLILEQYILIHLYFLTISLYVFVPWQHPNIFLFFDNVPLFLFSNNIPAYFFSFFGHWFCILLFSDKILNIPQTKSLDIYRRIFCIIRQYNCKPFVGQHPCIFFLKLCSSLYWTI